MRVFTIFTLDRMDFEAIFQQISLKLSAKLYALSESRAKRLCSQNPRRVYSTPSEFSAILCVLFGNRLRAVLSKIEIFLLRRNFRPVARGPLGCLLGFWPSGPKPCGGKNRQSMNFVRIKSVIENLGSNF